MWTLIASSSKGKRHCTLLNHWGETAPASWESELYFSCWISSPSFKTSRQWEITHHLFVSRYPLCFLEIATKNVLTGLGSLDLSLRCLHKHFIKFTVTLPELCGPHLIAAPFRGTSVSSKAFFLDIRSTIWLMQSEGWRLVYSCVCCYFGDHVSTKGGLWRLSVGFQPLLGILGIESRSLLGAERLWVKIP